MTWQQLTLETPSGHAEPLAEWLEAQGAVAVTFEDAADQPLYEPAPGTTPLWDRTRVTALLPPETDPAALVERLQATAGEETVAGWQIHPLEESDWERAWMDRFEPMRFGRRVWVVPTWHQPPDPGAINILLDPGLAFGTGTHPTTALCLEWLDANDVSGLDVVDYGCGSGVLAVAAGLLGAARVRATDNEAQALTATRENAGKNGVADRIETFAPEELPAAQADLVLANILSGTLVELAERLAGLVRPGGRIVLSGILPEQAEAVTAAYRPWFRVAEPTEREGWVRLDGFKAPR